MMNIYNGLTFLGKTLKLTLADVNKPKIYEFFNVSYDINDYLEENFKPEMYKI